MNGRRARAVRVLPVAILAAVLAAASCDSLVPAPYDPSPTGVFDALWDDVDASYALFGVRHVDWDSLRAVYRPQVGPGTTDEDLEGVLCSLLQELGDAHVTLFDRTHAICTVDDSIPYFPDDVSYDDRDGGELEARILWAEYLARYAANGEFVPVNTELTGGRRFLYLRISSFGDDAGLSWRALDHAFAEPPACDGLILDLRGNPGGLISLASIVIDGLADADRPYLTVRRRNGPTHDEFTAPATITTRARGVGWGSVPVVALSHRLTASAAEHVLLALRVRPSTAIVGDYSLGIFSARGERVLPNGWQYSLSFELVADADGVCWEGVGVPPDVLVRNTAAAAWSGHDLAMDAALTILGGTPPP